MSFDTIFGLEECGFTTFAYLLKILGVKTSFYSKAFLRKRNI